MYVCCVILYYTSRHRETNIYLMAYANAADPLIYIYMSIYIHVISGLWFFGRKCRGVRPGRKRR